MAYLLFNTSVMRRLFTTVLFSLVLAAGTAMAFSASDNKGDKKDKGQKPILIIVYVPAWNPIIREASLPDVVAPYELNVKDSIGTL